VFRNVIAAPLAGVAVQLRYCSSGSVGAESAAMIGGLIVIVPVPPAPETMPVMRNVFSGCRCPPW
jgi:hypothetical protein